MSASLSPPFSPSPFRRPLSFLSREAQAGGLVEKADARLHLPGKREHCPNHGRRRVSRPIPRAPFVGPSIRSLEAAAAAAPANLPRPCSAGGSPSELGGVAADEYRAALFDDGFHK